MPNNRHIHRVYDIASEIAEQNAFMRGTIAKALAVLKLTIPDTFLGREMQEPFPTDEDD